MSTHEITIAAIGDWLPEFEAPYGENRLALPYRERMKLELLVEDEESLSSVYRRALEHWRPQVTSASDSKPEDLMSVIYWIWFYVPEDENGLASRYESARDLILVTADGRARWDRPIQEIPYGDLIRAGEQGLLRGDPHRPYLPLLLPQGGGDLNAAWETIQLAWMILGQLLTAREAFGLAKGARDRLGERLTRRGVAKRYADSWTARGGTPRNVMRTVDRRPWTIEELRMVMGIESDADAADLLALFGYEAGTDGRYAISDSEEARLLRLAEQDVFETFVFGATDAQLRPRLERLLQTGEIPSEAPDETT